MKSEGNILEKEMHTQQVVLPSKNINYRGFASKYLLLVWIFVTITFIREKAPKRKKRTKILIFNT